MKTAARNPISSELSHTRTSFMVKLALMVAIIFVMAFSPLGYLRTPGLTITFLTVPVAVGAIILGPTAGAICGAAFGLTSVVMALTGGSAFSAALLQINPFGLLFTCLVPRILEGWICGLIFQLVKKFSKNGAFIVASLSCPLLNTLFFMSSLVLFFYNTEYIPGPRYQARRNESAYFRDSVCRCSGCYRGSCLHHSGQRRIPRTGCRIPSVKTGYI